MKYVKFYCSNGYPGCEYVVYEKFEDNVDEEYLDEYLIELAMMNAERHEEWVNDEKGSYDYEINLDSYYDNVVSYSYWCYITEEEFDSL